MTTVREVADRLGVPTAEPDMEILGVSTFRDPKPRTLSFVQSERVEPSIIAGFPETVFLVREGSGLSGLANVLEVKNPRLSYALVLRDVLGVRPPAAVASSAQISAGAKLGADVSIGEFAVIEDGVELADGVVVGAYSLLRGGVRVGANTYIGSHASIGGPGFGFEMDEDGRPIRIGHRGGVRIGDEVEIGQHVSIAQGTIEPTVIADHVKIDDHVFIAHNVVVGENSFIIAGAEISGSVTIGRGVWISPEASLINKITVGDDALVGIGAVVVRDVEANTVVAGVPAKPRGERYPGGR